MSQELDSWAQLFKKVDNAVHLINLYPVDNAINFPNTNPLDSNLSGGWHYPTFELLEPVHIQPLSLVKFTYPSQRPKTDSLSVPLVYLDTTL